MGENGPSFMGGDSRRAAAVKLGDGSREGNPPNYFAVNNLTFTRPHHTTPHRKTRQDKTDSAKMPVPVNNRMAGPSNFDKCTFLH